MTFLSVIKFIKLMMATSRRKSNKERNQTIPLGFGRRRPAAAPAAAASANPVVVDN